MLNSPYAQNSVTLAPNRHKQTGNWRTHGSNTVKTGIAGNSTPLQRTSAGQWPASFNASVNRSLLAQRHPFSRPSSRLRTRLTSGRPSMTLNPGSIPSVRNIGTQTARAASGLGVAPAPQYPAPNPAYLGIRNNALQQFGVPTIRAAIQRPPQGGIWTSGYQKLLANGRGVPTRHFVHN
jgi:hypothetical protein